MEPHQRRAALAADIFASTGLDESVIETVVLRFYEKVRDDALLGPVFAARIVDWEPHLRTMIEFWSSVALLSGRYHGRPMEKHLPLPVDGRHFDRWLTLFEETAHEVCGKRGADYLVARASKIAESLELGIAAQRGILLMKGERLAVSTDDGGRVPAAVE